MSLRFLHSASLYFFLFSSSFDSIMSVATTFMREHIRMRYEKSLAVFWRTLLGPLDVRGFASTVIRLVRLATITASPMISRWICCTVAVIVCTSGCVRLLVILHLNS